MRRVRGVGRKHCSGRSEQLQSSPGAAEEAGSARTVHRLLHSRLRVFHRLYERLADGGHTKEHVLNQLTPVSDILSGTSANGASTLNLDQAIAKSLRHSLSNWMVNKGKVESETVQGILRRSRVRTTLNLYTQEDALETRAAQGAYLRALVARPEVRV